MCVHQLVDLEFVSILGQGSFGVAYKVRRQTVGVEVLERGARWPRRARRSTHATAGRRNDLATLDIGMTSSFASLPDLIGGGTSDARRRSVTVIRAATRA